MAAVAGRMFRLTEETMRQLDEIAGHLSAMTRTDCTRTDAVKYAVSLAYDGIERSEKKLGKIREKTAKSY